MNTVLLHCVALFLVAGQGLGPGDYQRSMRTGSMERSYRIHVPPQYDAQQPTPVVLVLHGLGMNGRMMLGFGIKQKSDAAGFVAVCPDGAAYANLVPFWNCGGLQIDDAAKADDVAFICRLLDALPKLVNVDRKRVYVVGLSNGGMMAHRLAMEIPDRIAAIATIAGTLPIDACVPKCPVPVLHFHGTEDRLVPYTGVPKQDETPVARFKSVDATIATWAAADGCPAVPKIETIPNTTQDGMKITRKTYGPGNNGTEVVLYVIEGGGHTWPGVPPPVDLLGKSTKNVSATDLIWAFFEKHPKNCDENK